MGTSSRRKGNAFERLVVNILRELGEEDAERNLEFQQGHAGHDVHWVERDGKFHQTASCKYGRQVPVTVYAWALSEFDAQKDRVKDVYVLGAWHRIVYVGYRPGNAWVTKALGKCDQLWCKRPGWPILVVYR